MVERDRPACKTLLYSREAFCCRTNSSQMHSDGLSFSRTGVKLDIFSILILFLIIILLNGYMYK
jgi:hypothetical protein